MKILIACEESQRVCSSFRLLGFEAYSCDLIPTSGLRPDWHIVSDVLPLINGNCSFLTSDGTFHYISGSWDCIIAFPPCTYLASSGSRWCNVSRYGSKALERIQLRLAAADFFLKIYNANCSFLAVENLVGYMNSHFRKPDQIIQPFHFGDSERKTTCLWLRGLPHLEPTKILPDPLVNYPVYISKDGYIKHRTFTLDHRDALTRSKTFPGVADAMAAQWGSFLLEVLNNATT